MLNDTISDMLTRVRNAIMVKSQTVSVPTTNSTRAIAKILLSEGFIESFSDLTSDMIEIRLKYLGRERKSCLTNIKRISKPGLRVYSNYKEIPQVLGGIGLVILSTSKGLMSDREARAKKLGGELICSIW